MYYHGLDEILAPTDANANYSGFVFDYRDEIKLYIWNNNGVEEQVFGGYISTCNVNEDLTVLAQECADRVIDLDKRNSLPEIKLKGYKDSEELDYQGLDFLKNYNNYGDALKFLLKTCEIPFNNNIKSGEGVVRENKYKLSSYGKKRL